MIQWFVKKSSMPISLRTIELNQLLIGCRTIATAVEKRSAAAFLNYLVD